MRDLESNKARNSEVLSPARKRQFLEIKFNQFYLKERFQRSVTGPWKSLLDAHPEVRPALFDGVDKLTEQQIDSMIELMKQFNLWP